MLTGRGGPKDLARAFTLSARACDGGNLRGCYNLGVAYYRGLGGREKDLAKARGLFERSCTPEEARGCFNLGLMRARAEGGPNDLPGARAALARACEAGNSQGCALLKEVEPRAAPSGGGVRFRDLNISGQCGGLGALQVLALLGGLQQDALKCVVSGSEVAVEVLLSSEAPKLERVEPASPCLRRALADLSWPRTSGACRISLVASGK
jgi:hypothetical protein